IAPRNISGRRSRAETDAAAVDADRGLAVRLEGAVPTPMDAVELEQVRGRGGAALDLVDVHDIEAVARARIVRRTAKPAERSAWREPAEAAHPVDAEAHRAGPPGRDPGGVADLVQSRLQRHFV